MHDSHISLDRRPGKLFEADSLPGKIIRIESIEELSHKHGNSLEISELVQSAERLYKELEEKFGIQLDDARVNIARFVSIPLPENISETEKESVNTNISHINDFLNGKKLGPGPVTAIPPFE